MVKAVISNKSRSYSTSIIGRDDVDEGAKAFENTITRIGEAEARNLLIKQADCKQQF